MKYELERRRQNFERGVPDTFETIAESDNRNDLLIVNVKTHIQRGNTYEEKNVINEMDENGDIVAVDTVKEWGNLDIFGKASDFVMVFTAKPNLSEGK